MRFILNNFRLFSKFLFVILLLLVFSCSDKEVKPFTGKKIDLHISSNSMASKSFTIKIDQVVEKKNWVQKGGGDTHAIPNFNIKFHYKKIFSMDTDQKISDEYFSLAHPVIDEKNIYLLSTSGNVTSIDKNKLCPLIGR